VNSVSQANTLTVTILDKEYQVACPEGQEDELLVSAKYLDKQMRSIRDSGRVIGLERIAVMAALNISYELLQASSGGEGKQPGGEGVKRLNGKLDKALYDLRQLEIS
jgi:cell division protein ZapA